MPTRHSLLSRLRDWDDQDSWRDFFETYWRLIYEVARRAGLDDAAAQDVVQETIVTVARQMPGFQYDPSKGRFRGWLQQITRRRIADHLRRQYRNPAAAALNGLGHALDAGGDGVLEGIPDPATGEVDAIWDQQWQAHITGLALNRVRRRIRPDHFQVFDLYVLQGWPAAKVSRTLGVSLPLVYVIRHRVGGLLKKELQRLQEQEL